MPGMIRRNETKYRMERVSERDPALVLAIKDWNRRNVMYGFTS